MARFAGGSLNCLAQMLVPLAASLNSTLSSIASGKRLILPSNVLRLASP
jgi:hypothetical protein